MSVLLCTVNVHVCVCLVTKISNNIIIIMYVMIIACMATQLTNIIIIIMHGCSSIAIHANPWPLQWEVGSSRPDCV